MATAIEFNHVSKQYRLGLVSTKTLSHDIRRWWLTSIMGKEDPYLKIGETNDRATKGNSEYVWALRDIDFKVEQGDVVGIIGKNGAGKSTLLKLLSRVTGPTTGTIRAHGRIGSLLEVGTGFHGEMTGRENIFMNGAILGMTRNEIQAKLDEIIDFSGCERYIDTPVKRYSSGMTVRLGFAVAAFLDPEILVVDEVLAVGDAEFQKKAIGKMKDVSQGEGRTVLFVSHNMASIKTLCNTGILLEKGQIAMTGNIHDVVGQYLHSGTQLLNYNKFENHEYSKDGFELLEIGIRKADGEYTDSMQMSDELVLEVGYRMTRPFEQFWLGFQLKNEQGNVIFGFRAEGDTIARKHAEGEYKQICTIPANFLNCGAYFVDLLVLGGVGKHIFDLFDIINFAVAQKSLTMGAWMGREPGDITPHFDYTEKRVG